MNEDIECIQGLIEEIARADRERLESLVDTLMGGYTGEASDDELRRDLGAYARELLIAEGVTA